MGMIKNLTDREYRKFEETSGGDTAVRTLSFNELITETYDSIALGYTSGDLTSVIYKLAGVTVATLTLSYTNGDLVLVAKS